MVKSIKDKDILFYDGECALCNGLVLYVLKKDKKKQIHFAALDSDAAKELIDDDLKKIDTVILYTNQEFYIKSNAFFELVRKIGGWSKVFLAGRVIPRFIRDYLYDLIAKYRMRIFGKADTCPMPSEEDRKLFLT